MPANLLDPSGIRTGIRPQGWRAVTLLALGLYVLFTSVALATHGWDPLWFAWQGDRYANLDATGTTGYDGQFVLYIARDGWGALPLLDNPAYRLQRILLPLLVRMLSFGLPALVPWMIVIVNAAAIVAATAILAHWLLCQAVSPWYALIYTLFIGTLMSFSRDLTEPLALCLAVLGATTYLRGHYGIAVVGWALAAMTKEITLIFPIGAVAVSIYQGKTKLALGTAFAAAPLLCWETYLYRRLGEIPFLSGPPLEAVPLAGIVQTWNTDPGSLSAFVFIGLAAVALLPTAIVVLLRSPTPVVPVWLLLHAVFVLLLPPEVYSHIMHAGRNAGGMILSLALLLPYLRPVLRPWVLGYAVVPTMVWLVPILRWAPWLSSAGLPGGG